MSKNCQTAGVQQSYKERNGVFFPLRETDWEVDCFLDDQVSRAIEEAEWDQGDVVGLELVIRHKNGIVGDHLE